MFLLILGTALLLVVPATGAGPATRIALYAGDGQSATVVTPVPVAPAVMVTDADNVGVGGVTVTFSQQGGGSVTNLTQVTGSDGIAATGWTLGTVAMENTLSASSPGLAGSPVTFHATALPGPGTRISIAGGDGQTAAIGTAVPVSPLVIVNDAWGN
ncbi:MAG: hypothetical protein GYA23_13470, partial [Methanomicrobiales archaeon]|nr:hypothetical protein [Methanomicrobiales archaeon]